MRTTSVFINRLSENGFPFAGKIKFTLMSTDPDFLPNRKPVSAFFINGKAKVQLIPNIFISKNVSTYYHYEIFAQHPINAPTEVEFELIEEGDCIVPIKPSCLQEILIPAQTGYAPSSGSSCNCQKINLPTFITNLSDATANTINLKIDAIVPDNINISRILYYSQEEYENTIIQNEDSFYFDSSSDTNILYSNAHPWDPNDGNKRLPSITTNAVAETPYAVFVFAIGGDNHADSPSYYMSDNRCEHDFNNPIDYIYPIPLNDIIATGEIGYPLYEEAGDEALGGMNLSKNNQKLFVRCTDNHDGTYTFSYIIRTLNSMSLTASFSDNSEKEIDLSCVTTVIDDKMAKLITKINQLESRINVLEQTNE